MMKKFFILIFACLLFAPGVLCGADLEQSVRHIEFDQNTLKKGFSVKSFDDDFWLPVFPGQYSYPLEVKMWFQRIMSVPEDKKAVSNFYWYEVNNGQRHFLDKPVLLSLKFKNDSSRRKRIYFFDKSRRAWRPLDSKIYWNEKRVKAWSPVPAASIVALENKYDYSHDLTAKSAIVIDAKTGEILFEKNLHKIRPIASLSKLVSALVFLDHNPGWHKMVTIIESDNVGGAGIAIEAGDEISVKNLFMATLMASANNATRALMRSTGLSEADFVGKMNEKAKELGTLNTQFVEPTGLSEYNLSTAKDLMKISSAAFRRFEFLEATTLKSFHFDVLSAKKENKTVWLKNTNKLIDRDLYLLGGKTGYTDEAGRCLVSKARYGDREIIALVLGADIGQNYEEVYQLLNFYFRN